MYLRLIDFWAGGDMSRERRAGTPPPPRQAPPSTGPPQSPSGPPRDVTQKKTGPPRDVTGPPQEEKKASPPQERFGGGPLPRGRRGRCLSPPPAACCPAANLIRPNANLNSIKFEPDLKHKAPESRPGLPLEPRTPPPLKFA